MTFRDVQRELRKLADPQKARLYARFFKTGKGEYGYGDRFLGITVPKQRAVARRFFGLPLAQIASLLRSKVHEDRFTALVLLVHHAKKHPREAAAFYLKHTKLINNWDLVDTSAPYILGPMVDQRLLIKMAGSHNLWERRIAMLTAGYGIRRGEFANTLKIATMLLHDEHDLIHKAVGWMLREMGKQDVATLKQFLDRHARTMPRTMLRYAIEKFSPTERKRYLKLKP